MRCRIGTWAVCSSLVAFVIAGCGGGASDNGVSAKSADGIVSAAIGAINSATSAHISGSEVNGGTPVTMNLDLVAGKGGRGEVSEGGQRISIEVVGNEVYMSGNDAFWARVFPSAAVKQLHGKWLKASAAGQFASIAQLTDLRGLADTLLKTNGALVKSGTKTIDGQDAVGVTDAKKGGTLYVATTGKPYPLELLGGGAQGADITLSGFNRPVTLTAPADIIDVSQLK